VPTSDVCIVLINADVCNVCMQQAAQVRYPITVISWLDLFTLGCCHGDTVVDNV